jgi:gamma-butyrobetaine dioxygenase
MEADPVAELVELYQGPLALEFYDEAVTELDHGLQCAALAAREDAPDHLVAAALLHDVGHLLVGDLVPIDVELDRDHRHERVGATYLGRSFGPEVAGPVRLHVEAKRYLCAVEPGYEEALSPSSERSLAVQGGAMTPDEVARFEAEPGFQDAVRVRRWDDMGKVADLTVAPFTAHVPMLRTLLSDRPA